MFEEKTTETCSSGISSSNTQTLTKHVDPSEEENVDKACLSISRSNPEAGESHVGPNNIVHLRPIGDEGEWSDIQATETTSIDDVREIAPDTQGNSLDIPVVRVPNNSHHDQGSNSYHHQP